jgi:hypothetical protein
MVNFTYSCTIEAICDVCSLSETFIGPSRGIATELLRKSWVFRYGRIRCSECKGVRTKAMSGRNKSRNDEIVRRCKSGENYEEIAKDLGLTRQRVHQIFKYESIDKPRDP